MDDLGLMIGSVGTAVAIAVAADRLWSESRLSAAVASIGLGAGLGAVSPASPAHL